MKRIAPAILFLAILWSFPALASDVSVVEGTMTTGVVDRVPADHIQTSPASVGNIYCFTRIAGAPADTAVTHVWYRDGKEMARITLPVRFADWRTWSSKKILPSWIGQWKVEILDAGGNILETLPFIITKD
jgi:hypothetical protein